MDADKGVMTTTKKQAVGEAIGFTIILLVLIFGAGVLEVVL